MGLRSRFRKSRRKAARKVKKSVRKVAKDAKRTKGLSLTPAGAVLAVASKGKSNKVVANSIKKASAKVAKAEKSVKTKAKKAGKAVKKAGKTVKKVGKAGIKATPIGFLMGAGEKKRKAVLLVGGIAAVYVAVKVVPKVIGATPGGRAISAMR